MVSVLLQVATFISAFLLFVVQPLYAKHLLPFFGGTATVWTVSIFFYSVTLLLGYIYATFITEWRLKGVAVIHALLLGVASLLLIRRYVGEDTSLLVDAVSASTPAFSVLLTLLFAVGLPVLLLASTSVITQKLYARVESGEPYRLYAVSNTGSVLGLLSYPFVIEPNSFVSFQIFAWMGFFIAFSAVLMTAWFFAVKSKTETVTLPSGENGRTLEVPWKILAVAAIPTFLLAAGTEYLSQGIASFPLLWVIPLTLYLLSFVVSFSDGYKKYITFSVRKWLVIFSVFLILSLPIMNIGAVLYWSAFLSFSGFFFLTSTYFHRRLYDNRPGVASLGRFYVLMTAGGAIGSGVVGLALPFLLVDNVELALVIGFLSIYFARQYFDPSFSPRYPLLRKAPKVAVILVSILFVLVSLSDSGTVVKKRNFYGVLHVLDTTRPVGDETIPVRAIVNGVTVHGFQILNPEYKAEAASYYGPNSGIDIAIRSFSENGVQPRIMVVGLGAGMINAYCDDAEHISYIEINPAVVDIAYEYFTYLEACPEKNDIEVGDGRLVMKEYAESGVEPYDVIMVDAFTDDAIPAHLLTTEAFRGAYGPLLAENGVVAVHTTNKYLNLSAPIAGMGTDNGQEVVFVENWPDQTNGLQLPTTWILLTSDVQKEVLLEYETASEYMGENFVWSDGKHSILSVLSWRGSF